MKEVAKIPDTPTVEFEKNKKDVERVIEALWSQERILDHGGDSLLRSLWGLTEYGVVNNLYRRCLSRVMRETSN